MVFGAFSVTLSFCALVPTMLNIIFDDFLQAYRLPARAFIVVTLIWTRLLAFFEWAYYPSLGRSSRCINEG